VRLNLNINRIHHFIADTHWLLSGGVRGMVEVVEQSSFQPPVGMSPMAKTLCELKKLLKSDFKSYRKLVYEATHVCTHCGRVANDKKLLCQPEKMKS
jgi:hypothetical protein